MTLPRIAHRKIKGEYAESAFLARAIALGFRVSKPWGDSAPYDFILEKKLTGGGRRLTARIIRVQVKSAWVRTSYGRYRIRTSGTGTRRRMRSYSPSEVDFVIAWVVPRDVWYVIPVAAICGKDTVALRPNLPKNAGGWERYREEWGLLG